ncbi:MAG: nucleotide sugar dehydrogenase [Armatimonadetes bacterium]|nr:nucleotide sugar dehydrogenase [Armatimonadota bacterium]
MRGAQTLEKSSRDVHYTPGETTVAIIGLGYVGLPLAVEFASAGFKCIGIDVDPRKVKSLNAQSSYIPDVPTEQMAPFVQSGLLSATRDFSALADCDAIVICVPTPLRKTKDPDISHILSACSKIVKHLKSGHLIILESTTYPGTTDEVILPIFEESGMKVGESFFLAFSPERVDPGNPEFKTRNICKIVGGVTPECTKRAVELYGHAVDTVLPVSSSKVAEMAKLLENTYRSVNIALANELALMCHRLNIDVWEVIDAAATKPFGYQAFYPGPGIGGHCIPLDPYYLTWKARLSGFEAKFIGLAAEINSAMPHHVVDIVSDALNTDGKCINGSRILILGVAYKKNVGDTRESPALEVMDLLHIKGARLSYSDPFVPAIAHCGQELKSVDVTPELLSEADCVVIITNHSDFDYTAIASHAKLIVDTRNAVKNNLGRNARVVKL